MIEQAERHVFSLAKPTLGEGMGGVHLPPIGGPPPGNFENFNAIQCPLVQSGASYL